ncbi:hypothetical protein [Streptomyces sp. NPDC059176]|uniref:hypothetical protein n=1 Tax=unclassified Streptomyces TaxID=2593676 RepID=UPI0036802795
MNDASPRPAGDTPLIRQALVEEATKKSGLVWVRGTAPARPSQGRRPASAAATGDGTRPLWHAWHEGALHVVGDGPGEQALPGLVDGGTAEVTVRSKDKGGRLVSWTAAVTELAPGSESWESAVAELKGKRLNAPDGEQMTERWARECRVLRLEPREASTEHPQGSLSAVPAATPATTRRPVPAALPRLLRRGRKRS